MRAIEFQQVGEPSEVLQVVERPEPTAGPGEVVVRMRARPINPSDLYFIRGIYGIKPKLPQVAGFEGVGEVIALGPDVSRLQVGQHVVPLESSGTWQEQIVVNEQAVVPLPPGLDDSQAAMLLVNPPTAWLMLNEVLKVQPGQWVIQSAGNSAVGQYVIELAKLQGIRTISVVRRRDAVAPLEALGGDVVICTADEDLKERVAAVTDGKGANFALDAIGGEIGGQLAAALARGGRMVVYGAMAGQAIPVDPIALIFRDISVEGFWVSRWFGQATPDDYGRLWGGLLPLFQSGQLHATVAASYDLADVVKAVQHAEEPRHGKILLVG